MFWNPEVFKDPESVPTNVLDVPVVLDFPEFDPTDTKGANVV